MNCTKIISSTTVASKGFLSPWLVGAPLCKRQLLTWGPRDWKRNKGGKPKIKRRALCCRADWWQRCEKSLVHLDSSFSDLSGRSPGPVSLDKALILVSPAWFPLHRLAEGCRTSTSANVKVFSRCLWGTKEDLYLDLYWSWLVPTWKKGELPVCHYQKPHTSNYQLWDKEKKTEKGKEMPGYENKRSAVRNWRQHLA